MIVGIGVDIVDVERFKWIIRRSPGVLDRILAADEQVDLTGTMRNAESLAGRFAAKEAVAKALGTSAGLELLDCTVSTLASGQPTLEIRGTVADAADRLGITDWHVSIAHDGNLATAYVIAERRSRH